VEALQWFVTGASSGMGYEVAKLALESGDSVVATARRPEQLDGLLRQFPATLSVHFLDVTKPAEVEGVISRVLQVSIPDVIFNNAGGGLIGATEEMTDDEVHDQLALNLLAPIQITRAFLKPMRERGSGRFLQMSSMGGQMAFPVSSAYHAAKWGLEGFSESLAQEVAEFGVFVTIVEPGATRTNFQTGLRWTTELPAYRDGAVGQTRRWIEKADHATYRGDPSKLAREIFAMTRNPRPPLRLTLGGDAYEMIEKALSNRLNALRLQEQLARSVEYGE
jgi:NAD(P)-dependent dehydrogenase (short-subunit alcohol dehydrogenase family)